MALQSNSGDAPGHVAPGAGAAPRRRRDFCICAAMALLSFAVYNANMRTISPGDTLPARFLPFDILRYHTLYLDRMTDITAQGATVKTYWMVKGRNGHTVSLYPVVTPVLMTPLYVPAVMALRAGGWREGRLEYMARLMEKLCASLIAAVSVGLVYLLLRRVAGAGTSALLAGAYAFGTNTWVISSQALWQHGMGELLLAAGLLLVTGATPISTWRALAIGGVCGLIACNRPPDALLAAAIGGWALWRAPRRATLLAAGACAAAAPFVSYNVIASGYVAGAYMLKGSPAFFHFALLPGVAGLLFSPGRGLFVFTPFLLFLPFGLRRAFRDPRSGGLAVLLCAAIALQLLLYAKADWRAGDSWGPRWLTDLLPAAMWLLAPLAAGLGRTGRIALLALVCASVAVQAVGAFWYTGESDSVIMAVRRSPDSMAAAWDIRNTPFIAELRHRAAPRGFGRKPVAGNIDAVRADSRGVAEAVPGTPLEINGWTLTENRAPVAVRVELKPSAGGEPGAGASVETTVFAPRSDVAVAFQTGANSGWSVKLPTDGLARAITSSWRRRSRSGTGSSKAGSACHSGFCLRQRHRSRSQSPMTRCPALHAWRRIAFPATSSPRVIGSPCGRTALASSGRKMK